MNEPSSQIEEVIQLTRQGRYAEAESRAQQIVQESALTDPPTLARLYNTVAESLWRTSRLTEAMRYSQMVLDLCTGNEMQYERASGYLNRGTVYREQSQYAEALDDYQSALSVYTDLELPIEEARARMNIANVLRQLLQYDAASDYLHQAFTIFNASNVDVDAARTMNLLGLICDEQSEPEKALDYYRRAEDLFERVPDDPAKQSSCAWLYKNIGSMNQALLQFDDACNEYMRALRLFDSLGNRFGAAAVMANLGVLTAEPSWSRHDDSAAETLLLEATQVLAELGDKHEQAKGHRALADIYERLRKWKKSSVHFRRFHELMQQVQSDAALKRAAADAYERQIAELKTEQSVAALYTETIRKQLEIIQRDLRTAERIQHSILPDIVEELHGFQHRWEVHAEMVAARSVGGDFYDVFKIGSDKLGIVVADVSGKGMPAALFMSVSRTMLKLQAQTGSLPGEVLTSVNTLLCGENVMSMFVTLFYAVLDADSGVLHYANAGHNPPFIKRSNGALQRVDDGGSIMLGVKEGVQFETMSTSLATGDIMFFYTDGVTEAMDEQHQLFGEEKLSAWLTSMSANSDLPSHIQSLIAALQSFSGSAGQTDDITVVLLRQRAE